MRVALLIFFSIFASAVPSFHLDAHSEANKFVLSSWEHQKAHNFTILDEDFVAIIGNETYNKEKFIELYDRLNAGVQLPEKIGEFNVTNAHFDQNEMLVFDFSFRHHTYVITAKPNSNIKGGYAILKYNLI